MAKVGVEDTLTDVKELLQENGHEVVTLTGDNAAECDCCCISGQDQNVMGMSETTSDASIVNCDGMTAEEVLNEVNEKLQQR
ncbi:YkuS family protein [Piscibacillus halophilus]|uniref:Uncharacterized protein family (UPF0180) n=1 Tax=Piscibacillus halophilus TaxID=571933 RepID=A0A1H9HGK2_9BACI|nr:YkuS family protein [Piscibacillus halophilus]SEQ61356.1 Uncharacterised protein family (UPF0180) [Piscibacillus halophilus]